MTTLLVTTELGQFSFVLHEDRAPITCAYFRKLATRKQLNNSRIFRILTENNQPPDDGYPISVLQIGPVERFSAPRHVIAHETTNQTGLSHHKWTVSAARFNPGELYASFFVCMKDEPQLDAGGCRQPDGLGFAAFGQVCDGFDILDSVFLRAEDDEMLSSPIPVADVAVVPTPKE